MTPPEPAFRLPWYVLKVRSRAELTIGSLLDQKSYETFVPTYLEIRRYSDRLKKVDTPLFPGYVFCRLDAKNYLPVLTTPGVEYVLGSAGEPEPVPEEEVSAIERVFHAGAKAHPWPYLKTGNRVRVEHGSFAGIDGIYVSDKGADRLVLSITMLQRSVSVEIDRDWVRPL